jgi:hypothetical protein
MGVNNMKEKLKDLIVPLHYLNWKWWLFPIVIILVFLVFYLKSLLNPLEAIFLVFTFTLLALGNWVGGWDSGLAYCTKDLIGLTEKIENLSTGIKDLSADYDSLQQEDKEIYQKAGEKNKQFEEIVERLRDIEQTIGEIQSWSQFVGKAPITDPTDLKMYEMIKADYDITDERLAAKLYLTRQAINNRRQRLKRMGYRVR